MRKRYTAHQIEMIQSQLDEIDPDELAGFTRQIKDGVDPRCLPSWKAPVEIKMPMPTRGKVIIWDREVRAENYGTEHGRTMLAGGYVSNGLQRDSKTGKYLMYSTRELGRAKNQESAKDKACARVERKAKKEKKLALDFEAVVFNMGCEIGIKDQPADIL